MANKDSSKTAAKGRKPSNSKTTNNSKISVNNKVVAKKPTKRTNRPIARKTTVNKKLKVSQSRMWSLVAILLIWIGMMVGGFDIVTNWWAVRHNHGLALTNTQPISNSTPLISGSPTHITISSVNINLEVIPGYYNHSDNSWTLSLDKAQWGTMTAKANNKGGDTYIYAHARLNVFYTLPRVQPGDEATITTDNGHAFTYQFISSTITTPEDTSILTYKGKPVLVLQTCTGLWYQYRQLFFFHLVDVDGNPANVKY